jgi:hypothetical protein
MKNLISAAVLVTGPLLFLIMWASVGHAQGNLPVLQGTSYVVDNFNYGNRNSNDNVDMWTSTEEHSVSGLTCVTCIQSNYSAVTRSPSGWFERLFNFSTGGTLVIADFLQRQPANRRNIFLTYNITPSVTQNAQFDVVPGSVFFAANDLPYVTSSRGRCGDPEAIGRCWNTSFNASTESAPVIQAASSCIAAHRRNCPAVVFSQLTMVDNSCRSSRGLIATRFTDGDTGAQNFCDFVRNSLLAPADQWGDPVNAPAAPNSAGVISTSFAILMIVICSMLVF